MVPSSSFWRTVSGNEGDWLRTIVLISTIVKGGSGIIFYSKERDEKACLALDGLVFLCYIQF